MTDMPPYLSRDPLDLWLGKPAPRYTSYPPAPFFHAGVTVRDYERALRQTAPEQAIALYIHVPFCRSLCLYCGCNTMISNRHDRMRRYLRALHREIELVATLTGRRTVASLHFGGGTPNILPPEDMRQLFDCLRRHFTLDAETEIAMELDPRLITAEQAQTLAACGVNRVSLGVQDFDSAVQDAIHRVQPYDKVAQACAWLREAGIARINFDLIYGLPLQTPQTVADTARQACALAPDRIALFSYAHVPQLKKHQKSLEAHGIPDMRERLALEQIARGILTGHGYHPIGIDHFATRGDKLLNASHKGKLHRNFQGYTLDGDTPLIGLGSSSISQTREGYFQNIRDARGYQDIIDDGNLPVRGGYLLSPQDRVRGAIIEQLMCNLHCDVGAICLAFGFPIAALAPVWDELRAYEQAGIVTRKNDTLRLTTPHLMAIRVICALFDDHTRHAPTPASRTA